MIFSFNSVRSHVLRGTLAVPALVLLAGCSTLPVSGPTGRDIRQASARDADPSTALPFRLVEIRTAADVPAPPPLPRSTLPVSPPPPTDLIGPGDILNVTIYEAGVTLFGRSASRLGNRGASTTAASPSSNAEPLVGLRVDDQGFIRIPFVGRVRASGRTPAELQGVIRAGLLGKSQDPQVLVSIDQSITNSVVLAGELNRPGRFVLPTNRETLIDTVALAGGFKGEAKDLVARVERNGDAFEIRLSDLLDQPPRDLLIAPGDRITLISRPQSFSVLGAPYRPEQIRFPRGRISLSEAVSLAGGVNPNQGDAAAVFVFRQVRTPQGTDEPVVYHVNMMKPGALFLAQRFAIRDNDLVFIGNAQSNQPAKMVQLLSQLFLPVTTVQSTIVNGTR